MYIYIYVLIILHIDLYSIDINHLEYVYSNFSSRIDQVACIWSGLPRIRWVRPCYVADQTDQTDHDSLETLRTCFDQLQIPNWEDFDCWFDRIRWIRIYKMANKWCRLPGGKLFHDVPMQSSLRVTTSDQGVGVEYRCSGLPAGLSSYRLRGAATIPRSVKQAIFRFKPCDMSRYVQKQNFILLKHVETEASPSILKATAMP